MFTHTLFSNTKWNKAIFRVQLARIRQVLMILVFLSSMVGMSSTSVNAARVQAAPAGSVDDCLDGTISYWKLDEAGTPTTFEDFNGDNDGTCSGGTCPTPATGIINGAMDFDGNDKIDVPDDDSLDWSDTDSFAVEAWVNTTQGDPGNNKVFIGKFRGGSSSMAWWLGRGGSNEAVLSVRDSSNNAATVHGTSIINDGVWHHLVGVMDRSNNEIRIYVDGVLENTVSQTYTGDFSGSDPLYIGYYIDNYHYDGLLDEVALYNRPLTETEIKSHYYLVRGYCDMCDTPIRIMPLGDSITVGNASGVIPDDTAHWVSFRKDLWESLGAAGYNVDFVGYQTHGDAFNPLFDSDHAGYGGITDSQIAHLLDTGWNQKTNHQDTPGPYLETYPTDVILLHIGTNGLNASSADVEDILDEIDEYSEDITVILARIINRRDGSPTTTQFNDNVEAMALARMDPASPSYTADKIIIIDLEDGAGIVYGQAPASGDLWDNLHPYHTGYTKMANAWLHGDSDGSDGLEDFLPVCAPDPTITSAPVTEAAVGQLYSYDVEATGNPAPTYTLTTHPTGMAIDENTGEITWTPVATGDYDVTVQAINSAGSDTQPFTITVTEAPPCPADMTHYWKLDETTSPYEDFYGSNDATCTDCPVAATGIVNGAQQFDGSSDAVNVADDDTFDWGAEDSFSIEYWMNSNAVSSNKVTVGRDDGSLHWWTGIDSNGTVRFQLRSAGEGAYIGGTGPRIDDGAWHHIVCVRDESVDENRVYVDGVLIDWATHDYTAGFDSSTELNLGHLNNGFDYGGILDEVALYDKALTDAEILGHYNAGTGRAYCETYIPEIISTEVTQSAVGQLYSYDVEASGNPAPTYTLTTYPTGMTIDPATGLISWTPSAGQEGSHAVVVEATNSAGTDTQPFTINVTAAPTCPADMISYWKLDETSGLTYYDFYDDNDGTCSSGTCPTPASGTVGGAQNFAEGDRVDVPAPDPDVFDFAADESFSVGYWVNTTQSCVGQYDNKVYIGRGGAFWLGCHQVDSIGVSRFYLSGSDDSNQLTGSSQINDGNWHFIVVGREASAGSDTQFLYVDGVLEDSNTATDFGSVTSSEQVTFGYFNSSTYYYYAGILDEIAFFGRVLPQAEIQQYYNNGLAGLGYCETPAETGSITIVKETDPAAGTGFDFTGDLGNFTLDDGESQLFADQPVGNYDVTESATGWDLDSVVCTGGDSTSIVNGVTIHLDASENITCTFTNEELAPPVCPVDMISYWKLDDIGSPTTFVDYYNGNDGACAGACPTPGVGLVSGAQQFSRSNGTGVNVSGTSFNWGVNDSFSIEFWLKDPGDISGNAVIVGRQGPTHPTPHMWVGLLDSGEAYFGLHANASDAATVAGTTNLTSEGWHHVVAVRDATTDKILLYIDGVLENSAEHTYSAGFETTTPLNIGWLNLGGGYHYDGLLDEVAIYNRDLTETEVQQHYQAGLVGHGYCDLSLVAPTITSTPVTMGHVGVPYTYDVEATGYPTPIYSLTVFPSGMTIDPATGLIEWTPDSTGDYDVTVVAQNSEGSDTQPFVIAVTEAPPFALRINSGGPTIVDGTITWEGSAPYVSGGSDFTFSTSSVDTATNGIVAPIPPLDVLKTVRHQNHTFDIPSVPDGNYTVRIIWTDAYENGRAMQYEIEDEIVLDNWNIFAEAGGTNIAVEKEFEVTVSDGDGMQIVASQGAGNDVFESAIEITARENEAPTITSTPVTEAYQGSSYSYDVEADGIPAPTYSLAVSPSGMTIDPATGLIEWTPDSTGDYAVTVVAQNSEGSDTQPFVIAVTEAPPFALRINSGGPTIVDGDITWESSAPYVTGGSIHIFNTSSVDTTANSIADPIPPLDVYKACRHQSPHTYNFSSVPDGDYLVRIHWIDQVTEAGLRDIDYDIEGIRVEEDWDVYAEAGGTFVAIDKVYEVTVSDGNGMQITSSAASGDAFESAIEIIESEELTVNVVGNGSVTLDPVGGVYLSGTTVDLTALADSGWTFDSWSGDLTGSTNPESITMDGDKTVTATFTQDTYTLTVNVVGNGSVTLDPVGGVYLSGTTVDLTALADSGWTFDSWSGDLTGSTNPESITMDGDKTVTATFAVDTFTLNYAAGTGGSLIGDTSQVVNYGEDGTAVEAVASNGYHFVDWSDDSTDNPRTDTGVTADITVTANFAIDTAPEIDMQRPAGTSIADNGTDALGDQNVSTVNLTYTIDNSAGTAQLTIPGGGVTAANLTNVSGFSVDTTLPLNVAAGDTVTLDISFDVDAAGAFSFDMDIANNDSDEATYDIEISGTGISAPTVTTNAATGISTTGATLNGTVNANNDSTTVTFEYGLDTSYGTIVTADQNPVTGTTNTAVSNTLSGLTPNTTYHYRAVGQNSAGTTNGVDMTFTTSIAPEIDVQRPAGTPIADSGTDALGNQGVVTINLSYTIENTGSAQLDVTGVTASNYTNSSNFSTSTSFPLNITTGAIATVDISFDITAAGAFSLDMDIANNDSDESTYDITISGTGVTAPVIISGINTTPSNGATLTVGPTQITVEFSENVTRLSAEDETNYLLAEAGANGNFDTTSCAVPGGNIVAPDDVKITINTATYDGDNPFISTLNINNGIPLPEGSYRLFICGTTSIENAAGIHLNNGADTTVDFTVQAAAPVPAPAALPATLPATGFAMGRVTTLSAQPASKAYTATAMMLEIPKLGVSMPIVGVPQSESGWDVTWLGNSAGYLAGSAFPTWAGNTVITGHVWDAYNNPGIFSDLKTLKYGDQIQIHAWGQTYTYEVRESKLVTTKNVKSVLQSEEYDWVTLVTCEFYNPFSGDYLFRRAVRAVLVSIK